MAETEILSLVAKASLFAQAVLLILVLMLFVVLWFTIRKAKVFGRLERDTRLFEDEFWEGGPIEDFSNEVAAGEFGRDGLVPIFRSGYAEYMKSRNAAIKDPQLAVEGIRAAMAAEIYSEVNKLQALLPFLANAASSAPYIGLLGTVVGIINAFRSLANTEQATIAHVAPGIAEALIATAMALVTAIPAVLAYNHYTARVEKFHTMFENFADRFCNIIRRIY